LQQGTEGEGVWGTFQSQASGEAFSTQSRGVRGEGYTTPLERNDPELKVRAENRGGTGGKGIGVDWNWVFDRGADGPPSNKA